MRTASHEGPKLLPPDSPLTAKYASPMVAACRWTLIVTLQRFPCGDSGASCRRTFQTP